MNTLNQKRRLGKKRIYTGPAVSQHFEGEKNVLIATWGVNGVLAGAAAGSNPRIAQSSTTEAVLTPESATIDTSLGRSPLDILVSRLKIRLFVDSSKCSRRYPE
jgi:hypothetical protein